jgi:hypothetical protein
LIVWDAWYGFTAWGDVAEAGEECRQNQKSLCDKVLSMNPSRLASIALAIVFFALVHFGFAASGEDLLFLFLYLFFCIMLIWYGDELGSLTGVTLGEFAAPRISKATPGGIVRVIGWCLLVVPLILIIGKSVSIF